MANIYALLVGINDYSPEVGKLRGALNDVDRFNGYLTSTFKKDQLHVEVLKDADATRDNIIRQFRGHLCKAGSDDVALFQYCGHGARWRSSEAFLKYFPDGWDEGIVCYDSRQNGVYDLADKELAVLLAEVASKDPHLSVIMDCCHSGSATRGVDDFTHLRSRQSYDVEVERPLETYIGGYYEKLLKDDQPLVIPTSAHVLMAACSRWEKAWESVMETGVFTETLIDVLDKTANDISYADLFMRCRLAVRHYADEQNPQFECFERFNAHGGFLGGKAARGVPPYSVYFKNDAWKVDCGAIHGLPTSAEKTASLALYLEDDQTHLAGHASTVGVGPQDSDLELDFDGDPDISYRAEIVSMPVAPIPVFAAGDKAAIASLSAALDPSVGVALTDDPENVQYSIVAENDQYLLNDLAGDRLIQGVNGSDELAAAAILSSLRTVVRWERSLDLQNHSTKLDTSLIDFWFSEFLDDGTEHNYDGDEVTLDFVDANIRGRFYCRNRTEQPLYVLLLHYSAAYGIRVLNSDPFLPAGEQAIELLTDDFYLHDDENESVENLKLFVMTEKVDDFLLTQDDLALGETQAPQRAMGSVAPRKKLTHKNEWFTQAMRIRIVRQHDRVNNEGATLANRKITIKPHDSVRANLSLASAKSGSRSAGMDVHKVLGRIPGTDGQPNAFELINLSATRGEDQSVLELTDIQNAESLHDSPLEIALDIPLDDDQYILPVTFDGEHILLGGDSSKGDDGRTLVKVHDIPAAPNNRRSLTGSLKLYFFKTYLLQDNVNRLQWVDYGDDGSIDQRKDGINEKVAAAKNIVLLVHGIIGDTAGMAKGLPLANDAVGQSVRDKFDLVLTYDYENLATPIEDTALDLRRQLASCGLDAEDDKRLTLLVHSMGGLVSRWFIEKLGGNQVVDHLVMCGTPNNGSPYGKIGEARKLISALATVALNTVPVAAPFCAGLLGALSRVSKVTPSLEQMNPSSEFIQQLNVGDVDPAVPYTVLAGNVSEFEDDSDLIFRKLLEKVSKGVLLESLFGTTAHDIAVRRDSILSIAEARSPAPSKIKVACHHLNHFTSDAGLKALAAVNW